MKRINKEPTTYSVLVEREVLVLDRVEIEAATPEEAAELAPESPGAHDWDIWLEQGVYVSVERDDEVLAEVAHGRSCTVHPFYKRR